MNALPDFANLHGTDALMFLMLCLVLYGAKKLPKLAQRIGETARASRKSREEFPDEELGRVVFEPEVGAKDRREASSDSGWVLAPLTIIMVLSSLGALTRAEVAVSLLALLLFWMVMKIGSMP